MEKLKEIKRQKKQTVLKHQIILILQIQVQMMITNRFLYFFLIVIISSCTLFKGKEEMIYSINGAYDVYYDDFTDYKVTENKKINNEGFLMTEITYSTFNESPISTDSIYYKHSNSENYQIYTYLIKNGGLHDDTWDTIKYYINYDSLENSYFTEADVYMNTFIAKDREKGIKGKRFYNIRKEKFRLMYEGNIKYKDVVDSNTYTIHKFFTYTGHGNKMIYIHDSLGVIKTYGTRNGDNIEFEFGWGTALRPFYTRALIELFNNKNFHTTGYAENYRYIGVLNWYNLLRYTEKEGIYPKKFPLKWSYFDKNFKD